MFGPHTRDLYILCEKNLEYNIYNVFKWNIPVFIIIIFRDYRLNICNDFYIWKLLMNRAFQIYIRDYTIKLSQQNT